ncbi:MAG: hypothetical protein QW531_04895 [Thermoplasmata archaeon]
MKIKIIAKHPKKEGKKWLDEEGYVLIHEGNNKWRKEYFGPNICRRCGLDDHTDSECYGSYEYYDDNEIAYTIESYIVASGYIPKSVGDGTLVLECHEPEFCYHCCSGCFTCHPDAKHNRKCPDRR